MTVAFDDYFWGDKNNGFDVLYHNMKHGLAASKELADFFREQSNIEENNWKFLAKLAKQAGSCCTQGTFAPLWHVLKTYAERLSGLHLAMVQRVGELVKEVSKYADELHKKHKSVKEDESGTLEAVQAMQSTTLMVQKAKDVFTARGGELEKLRKDSAPSPKEIEKAETKYKKAQEDYRSFVEKYAVVKEDFERKMTTTCRRFQELEEAHLTQMRDFINTYVLAARATHEQVAGVHADFERQCLELTVDKLLEQFVLSKYTGLEKPGLVDVDDGQLLHSPVQESQDPLAGGLAATATSSASNSTTSMAVPAAAAAATPLPAVGGAMPPPASKSGKREGFLRSRRDKAKQKKANKKKKDSATASGDNQSNKEEKSDLEEKEESTRKSQTTLVEGSGETVGGSGAIVDEEGYIIQPTAPTNWPNDKGSFYSSSDSDSDDERERKIRVEIKPLNNGTAPMSASVDELRATVENLYLLPAGGRRGSALDNGGAGATAAGSAAAAALDAAMMKRSQSVSQQIGGGKPVHSDLLGLNFQSPAQSNASTPTSTHPYAPLQSPSQPTLNSPTLSASSRYADLGDLFNEVGEMQPPSTGTTPKPRQTPTPTSGYMSIPRPPSRRSEAATPRGHISPSNISRADSVGSLEFRTACVPVGVSRGPSPLTIGMADTIPLAVAFHEMVHSYFKGADETKCQVKMSGDMMLSFPAGIVTVLANNPNPAKLTFRVHNTQKLSILPNKQLVTIDSGQSAPDSKYLEFNMTALSALLKKQSEMNPSASYFNVDILKYQIKPKQGANSCPLQLVAYWKCEDSHTDLKVDYKYNSHAMSSASPLLNVCVTVPVDGGVKSNQSKPAAAWNSETNQLTWKYTELSLHSENHGVGSMLARFDVDAGPSKPATIAAQFNCEGTTLSGIGFHLPAAGYRLSLVKRRFISGRYICDGDLKYTGTSGASSSGTATPSSSSTASAGNC